MVAAASVRELGEARAVDVVLVDALGVPVFGFNPSKANTSVQTSVPSANVSTSLLASNPARKGFIIHNDSTRTLRVSYGVAASMTAFSLLIPSNGSYEGPLNGYTGELFGIWNAVNGNARVTELS